MAQNLPVSLDEGWADRALQANHQFTPDAIALLLVFIVEELFKEKEITILEMGSGMGNFGRYFLDPRLIKGGLLGNGSG